MRQPSRQSLVGEPCASSSVRPGNWRSSSLMYSESMPPRAVLTGRDRAASETRRRDSARSIPARCRFDPCRRDRVDWQKNRPMTQRTAPRRAPTSDRFPKWRVAARLPIVMTQWSVGSRRISDFVLIARSGGADHAERGPSHPTSTPHPPRQTHNQGRRAVRPRNYRYTNLARHRAGGTWPIHVWRNVRLP